MTRTLGKEENSDELNNIILRALDWWSNWSISSEQTVPMLSHGEAVSVVISLAYNCSILTLTDLSSEITSVNLLVKKKDQVLIR